MPQRPDYLDRAVATYRASSKRRVHATIALALAAAEFRREVETGRYGAIPNSRKLVVEVLKRELSNIERSRKTVDDIVSRLFDTAKLAERTEALGLKLDEIASQGVLFALVAAWKKDTNRLAEMVKDASVMTIENFRSKWNKPKQKPRKKDGSSPAYRTLGREQVIAWLDTADIDDVEAVCDAAETRLREFVA